MRENWIVTAEDGYPIQPQHIDTSQNFGDSFGKFETEVAARWIVQFIQERGEGWKPFTYDEINAFYESNSELKDFGFSHLVVPQMRGLLPVGGGWIVVGEDEKYYVTHEFITRCFGSRPVRLQPASV